MEATSALMMTLGAAILFGSWIVLMVASWREDYSWGLCSLLLPPLSYLYALTRLDKAGEAIVMAGLGLAMIFLAF